MLTRLFGWFTAARRKRIYQAVAAVVPLLLLAGVIAPGQVDPILTLVSAGLGLIAGVLQFVNLTPPQIADWYLTAGRAAIYSGAVVVSGAVVALGLLMPETGDLVLKWVSGAFAVISAILGVVFLKPDPDVTQ